MHYTQNNDKKNDKTYKIPGRIKHYFPPKVCI